MQNKQGRHQAEREGQARGNRVIAALAAVLVLLMAVIIFLLLRSCGAEERPPVVLEPDYPSISTDPNATPIEDEPAAEKPVVTQGGGSVTISFMDNVIYSASTGRLSLFYQNPGNSTHNVVLQVILVRGEEEYLLSQSGVLEPGYQVTSLTAAEDAPQLSPGGYEGKLRLLFYDMETGERAIVDTDIPCTVTVTE